MNQEPITNVHSISTIIEPVLDKVRTVISSENAVSDDDISMLEDMCNGAATTKNLLITGLEGVGEAISCDGGIAIGTDTLFKIGCLITEVSNTIATLNSVEDDARFALRRIGMNKSGARS